RPRRPLHGRGGASRVLRGGEDLLGGALRGVGGRRSPAELLLHRFDHGPPRARARRRAARRESPPAAPARRSAARMARVAPPAPRDGPRAARRRRVVPELTAEEDAAWRTSDGGGSPRGGLSSGRS